MNIEAKNLSKIYGDGENRVVALDHANLDIVSSDFISIMGPSGSGKKYPASICFPAWIAIFRFADLRW